MSDALSIDDPAYFDRLAAIENRHWWSSGMGRIADLWLDRTIRGRAGLVALDVGCGVGGTISRMRSRPEVASAFGIDPSRSALDRIGPSRVALASALALPFAPRMIDVVTCLDVLQHLPDGSDHVALRQIHRVLKPGGVAILRANGRGLWPPKIEGVSPYRLRHLSRSVRESGLRVLAATYANFLPSVAAEVLGKLRPNGGLGHPSGGGLRIRDVHPTKNRVMSMISHGEAYAAGRLGVPLPIGHSTMILAIKPEESAP